MNHDGAILYLVSSAHPERTSTGLIERVQLLLGSDDLRLSGKVRPLNVLAKVCDRRLGGFKQMNRCGHHLVEIMRRNICRHAHCDAGGAVQQQVRHLSRQDRRLFQRAVEVGLPIDRALPQLG